MVTDCGTITWYVMTVDDVQFWMRDDGPMTLDELIQQLEKLGEREPASNRAS